MSNATGNVSVGNTPPKDSAGEAPQPDSKTLGEASHDTPAAHGEKPSADPGYGEEGTNKTMPMPKPDNAASDELGQTRFIPKSPYTRG
jgi:hypothetical protein